ncbi:very-long-chain (3R)-3-hydroxyacyl-CoA dehydratase PASTICCINO 2A isoform X2 [Zea mays]|uniref:very-long-chain (3R)-3-hydroxyacyl-CoA dehydratase PASTICCINO 2A isoform X2 n=1 Tax=Zea mays TaxID=4577 RepID=UPI0009AA76E2|nr:uncharacterized protein LOC100383128 isoform X2 [Zea mays]|eukprot:XP_020397837.1 uncharacterized LOC100383128 isoform X2 [Zea mays]
MFQAVKATTLKPWAAASQGLRLPPCSASMAAGDDGSAVRRLYLSVYNWVSFFGWLQVLYHVTLALLGSGHQAVYAAVKLPLLFSQTAALAEILHSITGLVRSPISATLPQVGARIFVTWCIVWSFPETQSHVLVTSLVLSWSITEVIRYPFFGLREAFGITPSWLLWLSTFTVLYPVGLISELGLIFTAMPHMKGRSFYICAALTTIYIPGSGSDMTWRALLHAASFWLSAFPHMYGHMLAQRKKNLSKAKAA